MNPKDKEFLMVGGIGALYGLTIYVLVALSIISPVTPIAFSLGLLVAMVYFCYDKPIHAQYE